MTRSSNYVLAVIAATCVFTSGQVLSINIAADQEATALQSEVQQVEALTTEATSERVNASVQRDQAQRVFDAQAAVLAERPAFVNAVTAASAAFASANGKVDVAALHAQVIEAQNIVLAEDASPKKVKEQTDRVAAVAADASAQVAAHDKKVAEEAAQREAARKAASTPRKSGSYTAPSAPQGGGDWFSDMRQRLNNVGGGHVSLTEYDGNCGGITGAAGCAIGGGIKIHSSAAGWSSSRKNWLLVHELAHTYHQAQWSAVNASAGYQQLFGSNPELLANCMASARGYTNHGHHSQCNGDRLAWAAQLWNGNIAW